MIYVLRDAPGSRRRRFAMRGRTKITVLVGLMLVGAFVVFMGVGGLTAEKTANVTVQAGVAPALQLNVNSPVDFGTNLAPGNTVAYTASTNATVSSNRTWKLSVHKGGDLSFTEGGNTYTIGSNNLTYGVTSGDSKVKGKQAAGTTFETTDTNICIGCDRGGSIPVSINYSLMVPWDARDGAYSAAHVYTANND
jgi:spore coat protein U-like protein